ncbi:MAG: sulfotransferase [Gammaproteobacteria bacterium]|nr:sulfotransferase [Gammaproteobacteria bacterium]
MEMQPPIFIGGMFKSGTTLLRAMLGQHSKIASGLETYWFDLDWDALVGSDFAVRIGRLAQFYEFERSAVDEMVRASSSVIEFLDRFLGTFARREGKRRWVEKTPGNIIHMDKIFRGWPDAKVIHIKRDPRDVYASLKQAQKWDTVEEFVERWCRFMGGAEKVQHELKLGPDRYLEVSYEKLVLQPRVVMKSVVEFVGEDWEEKVAQFSGKSDDYEMVLQLTGKASTTLERLQEPLSQQRVGIWKGVVAQDELKEIRKLVSRFGLLNLYDALVAQAPAH